MSIAEPRDLIEVLSRLESWRREQEGPEQQTFRRFTIRADASLEPLNAIRTARPPLVVMLRDISCIGVGFLSGEHLERNSFWRLRFYSQNHRVGSQPICVRYCRMVQDGLYLVGGQFVIEPSMMTAVGVDPHQLTADVLTETSDRQPSEFLTPASLSQPA